MGKEKLKILIVPVGNPRVYQEVTYYFKREKERIEKTSSLTIPVLEEGLKPDKTFVLVPDSTGIDDSLPVEEGFYDLVREEGIKIVKEKLLQIETAENVDRFFLSISNRGRFRKPGRDSKKVFNFNAGPQDYYYDFIYQLTHTILLPEEVARYDQIEIYLDITHGINFMPIFVYRGILTAASLLAFLKPGGVRVKVFNTDPFIPGATKILKINQIEDKIATPISLNQRLERASLLKPVLIPKEERRHFFSKTRPRTDRYEEELNSFISSFYYGFPLVMATLFPSVEEIESHLERMYKSYFDWVEVRKENDTTIEIDKKVQFTPAFELVTLSSWQARLVREELKLSPIGKEGIEVKELQKIGNIFGNNSIFIAKELHDLAEKGKFADSQWECYSRVMDRTERVNGEIVEVEGGEGSLKREIEEFQTWILQRIEAVTGVIERLTAIVEKYPAGLRELEELGRLMEKEKLPPLYPEREENREELGGKKGAIGCGKQPGIDIRNFRAHAGLERNSVEVKREGERVKVRYAPVRLAEVAKVATRGLSPIRGYGDR